MSYQDHGGHIDQELRPLADALRRRYPGVRIVWALFKRTHCGTLEQCVRYQAPLKLLRHVGLVDDAMPEPRRSFFRTTKLGCGFSLCEHLDQASRPGCWDLIIYTGTIPRDPDRIGVRQAARLLRRIAKCIRVDGAP